MKLACISDIHGKWKKPKYPDADILIFAGDILRNYAHDRLADATVQLSELKRLNKFLSKLKDKYKEIVIVSGNHDFVFERMPTAARLVLTNAIYLQDEEIIINGIKFYGSPWQPYFCNWAFNFPDHRLNMFRARAHARKCWSEIPNDTNVLITHGPPHEVLDLCWDGRLVGCLYLKERLQNLTQLKAHIFGHIHYSYGQHKKNQTTFVNAAACDENYNPTNPIQVIEI